MNKKLLILSLLILSSSGLLFPSRQRKRKKQLRQRKKSKKRTNRRRSRKKRPGTETSSRSQNYSREWDQKIKEDFFTAKKLFDLYKENPGIKNKAETLNRIKKLFYNVAREETDDNKQVEALWYIAIIYGELDKNKKSLRFARRVLRHKEHDTLSAKQIAEMNYTVGKNTRDSASSKNNLLKALHVFKRNPEEFTPEIIRIHYKIGLDASIKADNLEREEGRDEDISELRSEAVNHWKKVSEFENDRLDFPSFRIKASAVKELGYMHGRSDLDLSIFYREKEVELIKNNKIRIIKNEGPKAYNKLYYEALFATIGVVGSKSRSMEEASEEIQEKLEKYVEEYNGNGYDKKRCNHCNLYANKVCSCQETRYCSVACQKIDWAEHKAACDAHTDEEEGEEETLPELVEIHYCSASTCSEEGTSRCTGCRQAQYCSVECQRADWQDGHNKECALLARPAEAE